MRGLSTPVTRCGRESRAWPDGGPDIISAWARLVAPMKKALKNRVTSYGQISRRLVRWITPVLSANFGTAPGIPK